MIRSLSIFFTICIFFACKPDYKPVKGSVGNESIRQEGDTGMTLQGSWINENYYNRIQTEKSPRQAQTSCEMCMINMPSSTNEMTEIVVNFHEIISYVLVQTNGQQFELWEGKPNEPRRLVNPIEIISKDKIKVGDNSFVRINSGESLNWNSILHVILFQGNYATEEGAKIQFLDNGEITGLEAYRFYEPVIDYYDVGRNVDQIKLGKTQDSMETFAFKFKKKKLQLYTLKCQSKDETGTCVEVGFGKQVFHFIKEK